MHLSSYIKPLQHQIQKFMVTLSVHFDVDHEWQLHALVVLAQSFALLPAHPLEQQLSDSAVERRSLRERVLDRFNR